MRLGSWILYVYTKQMQGAEDMTAGCIFWGVESRELHALSNNNKGGGAGLGPVLHEKGGAVMLSTAKGGWKQDVKKRGGKRKP